jgi:F-type H+-transporting ATPase subunit gamma
METLEALQRKIASAEDLQSVVKTMKALAAVHIRQYEKAVDSLAVYHRIIERGLHVVLTARQERALIAKPAADARLGALVFGSDQGMCGQLNEQVVAYALTAMDDLGTTPAERTIAAVGGRVAARLEEAGQPVEARFEVPNALPGITPMVQELLLHLEAWHTQRQIVRMYLFYSQHLSSATFRPHIVHLLPVNQVWLTTLAMEAWPTRVLPTFTMDWDRLFSALIRQYLFVSLYRACAESLASENASRLAAMQGAEKNIDDRLAELQTLFRQQRQTAITEELLDIVAGFEALTQPEGNGSKAFPVQ